MTGERQRLGSKRLDEKEMVKYLRGALAYFAGLGILTETAPTSDADLLKKYADPPIYKAPVRHLDAMLLVNCGVGWLDATEEVYDDPEYAVSVISQCAAISRGAFGASNIECHLGSDSLQPWEIEFDLNGNRYRVDAPYGTQTAWAVNSNLLGSFNGLIEPSGKQFISPLQSDPVVIAYCMTEAEKKALRKDRGWLFEGDKLTRKQNKAFWKAEGCPEAAEY